VAFKCALITPYSLSTSTRSERPLTQAKLMHFAKPYLIESQNMKHTIYDILAAVAIGLLLTVGALAYFDILWS
jgi:hypothetical protein